MNYFCKLSEPYMQKLKFQQCNVLFVVEWCQNLTPCIKNRRIKNYYEFYYVCGRLWAKFNIQYWNDEASLKI